ncbi:MAG: rod shape-determining protein MreC [Alphaproteobacteria bacterium]|nr:rod shape-determining protein MreC [Alphaproteobacteria bacterium]
MARRRSGRRGAGGFRLTVGALVAVGLACAAWALLALRNPTTGQVGPEAAVDDALAGSVGAAQESMDGAATLSGRLTSMWTAAGRVKELERENAELREWKALALALAERNARYESLLKMAPGAGGPSATPDVGVTARLVLDVGGPFRRTLLANAGADQGVKSGFVAVNENGLVGRVVSVGRTSARVLLLDDYNSRIPVMGQTSRVRAILVGDPGGTPALEGLIRLSQPKLQNVVGLTAPREGEMIVTSGDGGLFPAGLPVGRATVGRDGAWRVKLGAASAPVDYVRLTPYAPVTPPEAAPVADPGPPPPPASTREVPVAPRPFVAAPAATPARAAPPPPRPTPDDVDAPPAPPAAVTPAAAPPLQVGRP